MISTLKHDVRTAESRCVQLEGQIFVQGQHHKHSNTLYRDKNRKALVENEYLYKQLQKAKAAGYIGDLEEEEKPEPTLKECIMMNRLDRIIQEKRVPTQEDLEYISMLVKQGVISEEEFGNFKIELLDKVSGIKDRDDIVPPKTRVVRDDDTLSRSDRRLMETPKVYDVHGHYFPASTPVSDGSGVLMAAAATTSGRWRADSDNSRTDDGGSSGDNGGSSDSGGSSMD